MKLSEEKAKILAHRVWKSLGAEKSVHLVDSQKALGALRDVFLNYAHKADSIDRKVREKITSLRRNVAPGSPEWEILYHKYFEEEAHKHL